LVILDGNTLSHFTQLEWWVQVADPLKISLILAFLSSVFTLVTCSSGLLCLQALKRQPRLEASLAFVLGLPSGISVLVLGLGVWLSYGRWIDPFEGSLFLIVGLQMTLMLPVALRLLYPLLKGIQFRELEAATLMGATPWKAFWKVEWPRWRVPVVRVFTFSAATSLGELGAVSLFYSEKLVPLPLLVSRLMQQYRFEEAQSVSGLLLILSISFAFSVLLKRI
jgi:thiamine transport system permease protein